MRRMISVVAVVLVMVAMGAAPALAAVAPDAPQANCVGWDLGRTASGWNTESPIALPPGAGGQMVSGVVPSDGSSGAAWGEAASNDCP